MDSDVCSACETCLDRCYFNAITLTGANDTALVDAEKCMGCGLCLVSCVEGAIALEEIRPEDFIPA